ncbi:aminotransferase DegT, partial [Candidatus Bathyarchaeota archaeon]|nr:aminotransferase DegT [Candidatus Bathyarchaeota archaeon]
MVSREIPPMRLYFPPKDIDQIKVYTEEILASGMLTLGKFTRAFENEFGSFHQVKHSVAVNSGTSALEIALRCVGIGNGDEVLVPTNTFSATVASVLFVGGKPVLTDVNPNTLCVDA